MVAQTLDRTRRHHEPNQEKGLVMTVTEPARPDAGNAPTQREPNEVTVKVNGLFADPVGIR